MTGHSGLFVRIVVLARLVIRSEGVIEGVVTEVDSSGIEE
jgi:hypothetical protein